MPAICADIKLVNNPEGLLQFASMENAVNLPSTQKQIALGNVSLPQYKKLVKGIRSKCEDSKSKVIIAPKFTDLVTKSKYCKDSVCTIKVKNYVSASGESYNAICAVWRK